GYPIPGLVNGRTYYAIVDPQDAKRVQLAASAADARAGRPVRLGTYPTLTSGRGTLPITSIDAAGGDTIRFGTTTWPDGSPLFTSGQTVRYVPAAGQFLGFNAADGTFAGQLPAGDYVVRVLPSGADEPGLAIQLLQPGQPVVTGRAIDLNDNPQVRLADGSVLQIFSFDADSGQINLVFPRQGSGEGEVPFPTPQQTVSLVNGQPVTYVEAFGTNVPGLEDGRTYFAIVDPATPGLIRLAPTAAQAASANPVIQRAVPKLETLEGRTLDVGNVEPGAGLVFAADPGLAAGTPVIYRAAPGKPVGGLVDGTTYYAYPQVNPFFEPDWPQYVVGLRTAADATLPLLTFSLAQAFVSGGTTYELTGIDSTSGSLAVALPTAAAIPADDGHRRHVRDLAAERCIPGDDGADRVQRPRDVGHGGDQRAGASRRVGDGRLRPRHAREPVDARRHAARGDAVRQHEPRRRCGLHPGNGREPRGRFLRNLGRKFQTVISGCRRARAHDGHHPIRCPRRRRAGGHQRDP
ncbi:MAG: hypothetical protein EBS51_16060, partial [Planctomycetia bacterium]|nr:hypothetical protein [Planctomycetia bacterium]